MDDTPSIILKHCKNVHLVGICGMGMAALAQVLRGWGYRVTGSDIENEFPTDVVLGRLTIPVAHGFSPRNIPADAECVIASSAYNETNVEITEARRRKIPTLAYFEALHQILAHKRVIAITGTHGKTTTTAMIGRLLEESGMDPTVIVGAQVMEWGSNARVGHSDWVVLEADEYQNKLQWYNPEIVVLTSIDWDHPDFFTDPQSYTEVFRRFLERVPVQGVVVAFADDVDVLEATRSLVAPVISYGRRHHRSVRIIEESTQGDHQQFFIVEENGARIGPFALGLAGLHNVSNATAGIAVGLKLGLSLGVIRQTLKKFLGTERRMQVMGALPNGAIIIDDYAHHPVEVAATLQALRTRYTDRSIHIVFQAHTYTRTRALLQEFAHAFGGVDGVVITDIFGSAREEHGGVTPQDLVEAIRPFQSSVEYIPFGALEQVIRSRALPNDVWVMMGAGEGWKIARTLAQISNFQFPISKDNKKIGNTIFEALSQIVSVDRIEENVPLSKYTTFRIGGPARWLVRARSAAEVVAVSQLARSTKTPLFILSGGANILVSDQGFPGIVLKCEDRTLSIAGEVVVVGAGVPLLYLAQETAKAGLTGAEFCAAIPGAVGGAIRGNAGAFGSEMKDIVETVQVLAGSEEKMFSTSDCAFRYRGSGIKDHNRVSQNPWVILGATLHLKLGDVATSQQMIRELLQKKSWGQSLSEPSAGCAFKNVRLPSDFWDDPVHSRWKSIVPATFLEQGILPAGWLIDRAELKGRQMGHVQVSMKHGNFILNLGGATAEDVMILLSVIKQKIRTKFGVQLEEEIELVGF